MTNFTALDRGDGTIAYEVSGSGPLVVCVPGMGDIRSTYRHIAPALIAAGYRVALTDLRGHGDSSSSFARYGDEATAEDICALIDELGGPAVVVGNSMAAGAAVLAAAQRPELVSGLVLIGPFVRDPALTAVMTVLMRVAMAPLWCRAVWKQYLPSLYAGRRPDDFEEHLANILASLRRPGHARAFSRTTHTSHAAAEAAIGSVRAPALVVMGEADPDFPAPVTEAQWVADQLGGTVAMVAEAGHYPQSQQPEFTASAILAFLRRIAPHA